MSSKFSLRLPKKLPKLLPIGAAFLIGGGAIAYLNFAQNGSKSLSPAGTQLVPQTALATLTVTTDELTWTKLRQFGTTETQQQLDGLLSQWKNRLFTDNGYSYKRDIKPWVGDRVTLAVLNPWESGEQLPADGSLAAATQDLVLVVPIADPLKAKSILGEGPRNPRVSLESRRYKGVDVQTLKSAQGGAVEVAVIGTNWLLLGNTAAGIEQAISTYKGGKSLIDASGYRKAANRITSPQPPGKNFAQIYLNIPAASKVLATPSGASAGSSILPLQGSEGLVTTALIESEGVRFEGTSWLSPKNDLAYSELRNESGDMPRRLPDDTLVMMSGSNLQQFWKGFREGNTSPPFFPNPQNLEAGLLTQTGLDLQEDVLPWAAGEFALGVLPPIANETAEGAENPVSNAQAAAGDTQPVPEPADGASDGAAIVSAPLMIMVQTNDRQMAESVWTQLDEVMASRYRFKVDKSEFEGGSLTTWSSPFQGVQFSHGWLPGNVVFFAVGENVGSAIAPSPDRSLAEMRTFQTVTNQAPDPNSGHFYLNLAQINGLDGGVFPLPQLSEDGATAAIQTIGLTATVDNRAMDYDLYVKLAKGAKPGPL